MLGLGAVVLCRVMMLCIGLVVSGCGAVESQDADGDGYPADIDCDDADAVVNPGAAEVCDGKDNNCSGTVDDAAMDAIDAYRDADGDGFGVSSMLEQVCEGTEGWSTRGSDCDDLLADVYPGAAEACDDGVVNDCEVVFCDEESPVDGCITLDDYCGTLDLGVERSELVVQWSSDCILQVTDELDSGVWGDFGGIVDQDGCSREVRRDVSDAGYFRLRVP